MRMSPSSLPLPHSSPSPLPSSVHCIRSFSCPEGSTDLLLCPSTQLSHVCSLVEFIRETPVHHSSITMKIFLKNFYLQLITMFCQFLLYSKVVQLYIHIHSFFHIILCHVPSKVIRYSSLCYTPGFHFLSTPNPVVFIY